MTAEEEAMVENLPEPESVISTDEAYKILVGETE